MNPVFSPAELYLPKAGSEQKWSVIACDQFTSDAAYWQRVEDMVGDAPSSLRLILPEAYLGSVTMEEAAPARNAAMEAYLKDDVLQSIPASFVYVEREVTGGLIRRGLVGKLDLEAYDWHPGAKVPVRASERTVPERLPPRIRVRQGAALDLPHVMMLLDDAAETVVEPLTAKKAALPLLYDFDLCEGGGHIRGWQVSGEAAEGVLAAMENLSGEMKLVVGDGNHSLAAAKACWENIRETLPACERQDHPARFALVEVNNVYDAGVCFEPIHRTVLGTDTAALAKLLAGKFTDGTPITMVCGEEKTVISVPGASLGGVIGTLQAALEEFSADHGGEIDYIHDDESAIALASQPGNLSLLLPPFEKGQLFNTVLTEGVFPKKSFSIGHARDKRYYLECRKLRRC